MLFIGKFDLQGTSCSSLGFQLDFLRNSVIPAVIFYSFEFSLLFWIRFEDTDSLSSQSIEMFEDTSTFFHGIWCSLLMEYIT